jgi:hypothetical protein
VAPTTRSIGEALHLRFSAERVLLIDRTSERVVPVRQLEAAA